MATRDFQFTIARLLFAVAASAVFVALSSSVITRLDSIYDEPTSAADLWTLIGIFASLSATIGVLWRGEEGVILGAVCGFVIAMIFPPIVLVSTTVYYWLLG